MKVLFPIGSFYPSQQGGPCNSVYALAKALVDAGHEASVVTTNFDIRPDAGIPYDRWTNIDGIEVYYINMPKTEWPIVLDLLFWANPLIVTEILNDKTCEILHSTMIFSALPNIAAAYAKRKNIPVIWSPRGSMMPHCLTISSLRKKLFLAMPQVKGALTGCHLHSTSDVEEHFIKEFMDRYSGESLNGRIHNIPNLVGNEAFTLGHIESPYSFKYLLYLGRIHPIKNIENLIEAFALAKIDQGMRLVIAGGIAEMPSYTRRLRDLVKRFQLGDKVVFTEQRIEGIDKATLYKHAEVFVLPSESENFGMVVVESLAQRTPVIASNKTPWNNLETHGAGYWVGNEPKIIAGVLEQYIGLDAKAKSRMADNAATLAQEYANEALISKYMRMYEEVAR